MAQRETQLKQFVEKTIKCIKTRQARQRRKEKTQEQRRKTERKGGEKTVGGEWAAKTRAQL